MPHFNFALFWAVLPWLGRCNGEINFENRTMFVDNQPFTIKGPCYSPVPIGEAVLYPPYGDYFTYQYSYMWKRDLPLIKDMGANTIRIYGWDNAADHLAFLDEVHAHGLKVMITFYLGTAEVNPVDTLERRQAVIDAFVVQVMRYANHPAILIWSFGNELNGSWNGFLQSISAGFNCGWEYMCINNYWAPPCDTAVKCVYKNLFEFVNSAAKAAKEVAAIPVTSCWADLDNFISTPWQNPFDIIPQLESVMTDIDIWSIQLYRGKTFGEYPTNFKAESQKLLLISEYGVDAYNDPCGWLENIQKSPVCFNLAGDGQGGDTAPYGTLFHGCQDQTADCANSGAQTQAEWDSALAKELVDNSPDNGGAVLGGFVMSWQDEYWKGASVQDHCNHPCKIEDTEECIADKNKFLSSAQCNGRAHFTCNNADANYHDLCGYLLWSGPDHYVNEQWFGIATPMPCEMNGPAGGFHLDMIALRPVFTALKEVWTGVPGAELPTLASCADLKPCHECLMTFLPSQLDKGVCDALCLTSTGKVHPLPTVSHHDTPTPIEPGFFQKYSMLFLGTIVICTAGALGFLTTKARRENYEHLRDQ